MGDNQERECETLLFSEREELIRAIELLFLEGAKKKKKKRREANVFTIFL
jgi:hypothetical protein